ncbi:MAG: PAS domain-containing protein [Flavisolibacter sp.]|nr:PAS domain-containing protein [Flavisolibacter sp.]
MPKKVYSPKQIKSENLFPVVGVGASAGGLQAFKQLVNAIPEGAGFAYILVQHLSPDHESQLSDILQKQTTLPVIEVTDHIKVEPDHIYIIPSNKILIANDGVLELNPRIKGEKLNSIDVFFTSLAEIHLGHAIGVVLSGTGSDGTVGLKTIKDVGGLTIAQDSGSAAHHDMPQCAINADVVDFILSPGEIPGKLAELIDNAKIAPSDFRVTEEIREDELFRKILSLIKLKRGVDFAYYKQTMIRRRILWRKELIKIPGLKEYHILLLENKDELDELFKDLLISVTAFFRDQATFEVLCDTVFPRLVEEKKSGEPIRIWIAGCSTGEEAYSMAICLYETLSGKMPVNTVQIFATDLSEAVISKARSGLYQKRDMAGVSEERILQFFTKIDGSYQINKAIRDMCVFAVHNLLNDPPFARLDLVSCRNVLIYMEPYLQIKAVNTFHYALNKKGILLLGKSESTGLTSQQFTTLNKQDKIYTKKATEGRKSYLPIGQKKVGATQKAQNPKLSEIKKDDFQNAADEALLARYGPVGVIVNSQMEILQFRGSTSPYLEAQPGKASHNILKMAKEGLSFELRNALHKAALTNDAVKKEGIPIDKNERKVTIEILPLRNITETCFLVLFSDEAAKNTKRKQTAHGINEETAQNTYLLQIQDLEKELEQVRKDMNTITEDQEAAYEELQSSNEELLSSHEEMQSLYEELETSKEEIQSTNEELATLNMELIERNEQLVYSRRYAEAIVTTIHEPLLILTKDFRIKNANKAFYEMFGVAEPQTEGKLFFEWENGLWNIMGLHEKLRKVLPEHAEFENFEISLTVHANRKSCLNLNALQILNEATDEQLILLTMQDITERRELEDNLKLFAENLEQQVFDKTKDLVEANAKLQQANEDLLQFASVASHDLQEPLRKIKTFASSFIRSFGENVSADGREVLYKIQTAADRMSQLIREVLKYSKLAQAAREFSQTDLDSCLKAVLIDLDLLISETDASVIYKESLPVIDAIPLQMNQLFYNILTNAFKFRKENTAPEVTVSFRPLSAEEASSRANLGESRTYIEIQFSDNGIGFEQQFATQIFQIFERLHSVDEFDGTGVGLALCKKIVENHHGDIYAVSVENEGTVFHIILPLVQ